MVAAKFPTVRNFLCYFELSTGAAILAWLDVIIYSVSLLILIVNLLSGMTFISSETLNKFTVLGLVIDAVVQLVLLFLFLCTSLAFLKGIKDVSVGLFLRFYS